MKRARHLTLALLCIFAVTGVANASWYDDYEAGIKAARAGNWSVVVQKMTAAIKGNPKEDNRARTYGAIFINYHPYYYRGVANMNLGRYEEAIADLERTTGAGELDLGAIEVLMQRAKSKLESETPQPVTPVPQPQPQPVTPVPQPQPQPVTPSGPTIDPALRQRASAEIANAQARLRAAQQRRATQSPQYAQALQAITDANTRNASARSNDDLQQVIATAQNAALLADSATAPGGPVAPTPVPVTPIAPGGPGLPDLEPQLRRALESYYNGEFDTASREFKALTEKYPANGRIWALFGASQYSLYAFELNEKYRTDALAAFKRAKQLGAWRNGLPERWFSRRIRKAFSEAG